MLEVKYLGWASFLVQTATAKVLFDPFDPLKVGLPWTPQEAEIVCLTHDHFDHSYLAGVKGDYTLIDSPGEYEIKDLRIEGIFSYHDQKQGRERGFNTIYCLTVQNWRLAHLGDLGTILTQEQLNQLGEVNVLIIPVGGRFTIDAVAAAEVVRQVEPQFIIPCHYQQPGLKIEGIAAVEDFLREMGEIRVRQEKVLKLNTPPMTSEESEVILLQYG